ncbi:hypothetical protein [Corynebacterium sp. UMB2355A]|uniref:hypothetical protein n=1 Tax=Corynebacterium sp. UMB2355A TaxID=3081222 RepID=UPI0029FF4975|nr:hypothetical protein [Corynebacterium sp. UMB2355A]WPJ93317.1 hypothetical protein R0V12_02860 [Corynebacterium sp. UMB2355A]
MTRLDSALGDGFFFSKDGGCSDRLEDVCKYSFDLSPYGNQMSSAALIFEMLNRYSAIYTDRVYIAIAAAMMGKDVYLFSCSSNRTVGIYTATIKDNYPKVELINLS